MPNHALKQAKNSLQRRKRRAKSDENDVIEVAPLNLQALKTEGATPHHMMALQRTVGNRAAQKIVGNIAPSGVRVQRLPSPTMVKSTIGEPKQDTKNIFGKTVHESTRYKAVLAALDTYNQFILNTVASGNTLGDLYRHYDRVNQACLSYIASKKKGKKVRYFQSLQSQILAERAQVTVEFQRRMNKALIMPKWFELIKNPTTKVIEDRHVTGSDKGGTHSVAKTNIDGEKGFFKGQVNSIPLVDAVLANSMDGNYQKDFVGTEFEGNDLNSLSNAFSVPAWAGMFDSKQFDPQNNFAKAKQIQNQYGSTVDLNLRLAQRDVAMHRLDQLLNGNVIARAEIAFRRQGNDLKEGSLMEKAKGKQMEEMTFGDQGQGEDTQIKRDDSTLQRMLSRLQLIDALAGQVDRNMSNFFIKTDSQGNVVNVTGIDNDMAFGMMRQDITGKFNFPGMSQYVDKDLAERIISLDPEMLSVALADLLTPAEIDALIARWSKLKNYLLDLKRQGKLLAPNQWDLATAQGMMDEKSSYYAKLRKDYDKPKTT